MVIRFNSINSLIIYFLIFILTSFFIYKSKNNKILFFLSLLPVLLLFGFRYCGTDIITYENMISRYGSMNLSEIININNLLEGIGFQIISCIFYKIGGFSLVNIIMGILILFPVYTVLYKNRNSTNTFIFSFIYLIAFFITSFNIMRQFVAVSFVFLGYEYLKNNQFGKYLFNLAIGFIFHPTAILGLLFLMFRIIIENINNRTKINTLKVFFALIIIGISFVISIRFVGNTYGGYVENAIAGGNRDFLVILLKTGILFLLRNRISQIDKNINYYFLFSVVTLIIGLTGFMSAYIKRLYYYFNIFECFSFSLIPLVFKQKRIMKSGIVLFYSCLFILTTIIIPQGHVVPLVLKIGG